jgi:D-3-phosphoglycerate dehydrogenase
MVSRQVVVLSRRLGEVTETERRLETYGVEVRGAQLGELNSIRANAADAAVIILGAVEPFGADTLAALPALRAIVRRGVGYDNVDVTAATRLGVLVANVPDASVEEVSDHALASLLTLERRLAGIDAMVRDGVWDGDPSRLQRLRTQSRRFSELTLGIVGFGRIGAALARKARDIYGLVRVHDVIPPAADVRAGVELVSFDELVRTSHHISLHLPLNANNRGLLGAAQIARMIPGSVLVNTARGGLVDEEAVVQALRSGQLAAAALDVTVTEPVDLSGPLLAPDIADRLLLTAHSAAWSTTAATSLAVRSVAAVEALIRGSVPASIVNPEVLASSALRLAGPRGSRPQRGNALPPNPTR